MKDERLKQSDSTVLHAHEMDCVSRLVAGVAHEINSPLGALQANAETIGAATAKVTAWFDQKSPDVPEEVRRAIKALSDVSAQVSVATQRVDEIVDRLQEFAQLGRPELQTTQVSRCLETTLHLVRHEIGNDIEIVKDFADVPEIEASPRQLNQLFMNLLLNAQEAIRQAGRPGLVRLRIFDDGDWLGVEVADNGCGIPAEALDNVFDPGFSTKGSRVGAGMGLAICDQIVRDHRGKISVVSQAGAGTRFTVLLPVNGKV